MNPTGLLLEMMEPLISVVSCHWMNWPALSVYVETTFWAAALTFVPLGSATTGTILTVVLSVAATIWPHCGPGGAPFSAAPRSGTTAM